MPIPAPNRSIIIDGNEFREEDVPESVLDLLRNKFGQKSREDLIAEAMSTPEGRELLAQAMVEPIRRMLDYASIGSKIFMVDELPQGAYGGHQVATAVQEQDGES